jgi:hypothetical protein
MQCNFDHLEYLNVASFYMFAMSMPQRNDVIYEPEIIY